MPTVISAMARPRSATRGVTLRGGRGAFPRLSMREGWPMYAALACLAAGSALLQYVLAALGEPGAFETALLVTFATVVITLAAILSARETSTSSSVLA